MNVMIFSVILNDTNLIIKFREISIYFSYIDHRKIFLIHHSNKKQI